jgi:hypothetical protein
LLTTKLTGGNGQFLPIEAVICIIKTAPTQTRLLNHFAQLGFNPIFKQFIGAGQI